MGDETEEKGLGTSERVGHGGGGRNHGLPLGEATPELRKDWKDELEKSGKYTPGSSIKDLLTKRDEWDASKGSD